MREDQNLIMLFDGVCNLCNGTVRFVIKRDAQRRFRFASQQSEIGQRLLAQHGMSDEFGRSVVLIEAGQAYRGSTAALRIFRALGGLWSMCYALIVIPKFIRDPVYKFIANRRYRWFGKTDACRIPSAAERDRFLE